MYFRKRIKPKKKKKVIIEEFDICINFKRFDSGHTEMTGWVVPESKELRFTELKTRNPQQMISYIKYWIGKIMAELR